MILVELLLNLLACFASLLSWYDRARAVKNRERRSPGSRRDIPPDGWKCPDASEISRVVGATPTARNPYPSRFLRDGHAPVRRHRPEPRPFVSSPASNGTRPVFSGVTRALREEPAPRTERLFVFFDSLGRSRVRPPRAEPRREIDPDDWTCPDFAEVARILDVAPVPTTPPLLPLLHNRQHPMWDRELDG